MALKDIGVYVHIPFCKKKCWYCDFNSFEKQDLQIPSYFRSLWEEIGKTQIDSAKTIYIGGGTPSYPDSQYIVKTLQALPKAEEITLEANPGTLSQEKLKDYYQNGVNRLSIGLQATQDKILKKIGRIHTRKDFEESYRLARKIGFQNISVDLMFGLPKQTRKDLKESIEYLLRLEPEHISCYSLILHDTAFVDLPSEEEREMYYDLINRLKEEGYQHYEISNFARPGKESKHNLIYWNQEEYIGLGAGASSYIDSCRWTNEPDIEVYQKHAGNLEKMRKIEEKQDQEKKLREYIILKLRLLDGLLVKEVKQKFGVDILKKFEVELNKLEKQGLLFVGERIQLTAKGLDLANLVWEEFV